jgi:hypothetical protein
MKINISKLCKKKTVSRNDGERINKILSEKWNKETAFDIDFNNILIASVSFMDEAFGKLALKHSRKDLQKKLRFQNILDYDRALLNDILDSRLRQKQLGENESSVRNN